MSTTPHTPGPGSGPNANPNTPFGPGSTPPPRSFVPVPHEWYYTPGGTSIVIHNPTTPGGLDWLESDTYVHLKSYR